MASIEFHYRPSMREKRSKGSVYIRVIHHRQTASVTTPWKLYPEEWKQTQNRPAFTAGNEGRFPLLLKIEKEMTRIRTFLEQVMTDWETENRPFTAKDIIASYRRSEGRNTLHGYVEKLSHQMQAIGRERTARGYMTTCNRIVGFTANPHLELREITTLVIRRFELFLQKEGKTPNTISFYMRNLRAIYNKAISEGLLEAQPYNPFEHVYTGVQKTRKRALSSQEMNQLSKWNPLSMENGKCKMENEESCGHSRQSALSVSSGLRQAQQFFLFCFLARGMSFVDLAFLKKENIQGGVICYRRKKTGQMLEVCLCKEMKRIIGYFKTQTKDSPYVFPIIKEAGINERLQYESALRTQNNRLKRLAAVLKVKNDSSLFIFNFSLSTHVARHSWATIAKENNIPLVVISEGWAYIGEDDFHLSGFTGPYKA